jgi:predicted RNA binding protein YcfA (HicA-like mRNA interferase family)
MVKSVNSSELIRRLRAAGWVVVHTVGSHHQFRHPSRPGEVTVPHPKKDLPVGTVRSILKLAGLE